MATSQPASASATAEARPMPESDAVTIAVVGLNLDWTGAVDIISTFRRGIHRYPRDPNRPPFAGAAQLARSPLPSASCAVRPRCRGAVRVTVVCRQRGHRRGFVAAPVLGDIGPAR